MQKMLFLGMCNHCDLKILKWFVKTFEITNTDVSSNGVALNNVLRNGNTEVTNWFIKFGKYKERGLKKLKQLRTEKSKLIPDNRQ